MTQQQQVKLRFGVLAGIIAAATLSRIAIPPLLGHPSNFAPIGALALFSGCYFSGKLSKFIVPLLAVWVGDIFVNYFLQGHWTLFYPGFYWQYGSYILMALIGMKLTNRVKPLNVLGTSLAGSALFFIISNFGCWAGGMYPPTLAGLLTCYEMGIPFFRSTLLSDVIYSGVLFGAFELAQRRFPVLAVQKF
ncbi:MAG TPA: DUF6580 family putative transport protein [Bacteroidia bacterium]|jgi:hypothetical protein|nr:DUF6580 family putative transport protein [Bacteroidia bacterium]